jgi:hypothetical protein
MAVKFLNPEVCVLGLRLPVGAEVSLDVLESQLADIQALVDAGDIAAVGFNPAPVMAEPLKVTTLPMPPKVSAPPLAKAAK